MGQLSLPTAASGALVAALLLLAASAATPPRDYSSSSSSSACSASSEAAHPLQQLQRHFANRACGLRARDCPDPKGSGLVCDRRHCLYFDQLVLPPNAARVLVLGDGRIQVVPTTDTPSPTVSRDANRGGGGGDAAAVGADSTTTGTVAAAAPAHVHSFPESPAAQLVSDGLASIRDTWNLALAPADAAGGYDGDPVGGEPVHAVFVNDFSNYVNYYHFHVDCLVPLVNALFDLDLVTIDEGEGGSGGVSFQQPYQLVAMAQRTWRGSVDWDTQVFRRPEAFYNAGLSFAAHPLWGPRALYNDEDADDIGSSSEASGRAADRGGPGGATTPTPRAFRGFSLHKPAAPPGGEGAWIPPLAAFRGASFGLPYLWSDLTVHSPNTARDDGGQGGHASAAAAAATTTLASSRSRKFLRRFAAFMHAQTGAVRTSGGGRSGTPRVALVHRATRRRILNEDALVEVASGLGVTLELLRFETLTLAGQVQKALDLDILVGMNGAGLINGLYLPPHAVAVQLVPFGMPVNFDEFGAVLAARGPYLEWHNSIKANSVPNPRFPRQRDNVDTVVEPGEFRGILEQALALLGEE